MTPAERFRAYVYAYRKAFEGAAPPTRAVRLAVRLGLAPAARFFLSDAFWLGVVLHDLERFCHAGPNQTTHVYSAEDPHGRDSAELEGRRQVYMRIRGRVTLTAEEEARIVAAFKEDLEEIQRDAT